MKKKIINLLLLLTMVCSVFCLAARTNAKRTYQATKYKSYNDVLKNYKPISPMSMSHVYAYSKLKTPYGTKKCLLVWESGCSNDIPATQVYVKKGKKVYRIKDSFGNPESISKDAKYIIIYSESVNYGLLKYKNGTYEQIQPIEKRKLKTIKKKYKINQNIRWK